MLQFTLCKAEFIGWSIIIVNLDQPNIDQQSKYETYDTYDRALERFKELVAAL